MISTPPNNRAASRGRKAERGNALIFVLLGIAMFAALAFTVSRGMRSQTTTALSNHDAQLVAADMMDYAQKIQHAVERLLQKGCSENDISFEADQWGHASYNHTPAARDECKVFNPAGGNVRWRKIPYVSTLSSYDGIGFNGDNLVPGVGTDCGDAACQELVMFYRGVPPNLCVEIDKKLNILTSTSEIPVDTNTVENTTFFKGAFNGSGNEIGDTGGENVLAGKTGGCYSLSTPSAWEGNYFYYVIMAR